MTGSAVQQTVSRPSPGPWHCHHGSESGEEGDGGAGEGGKGSRAAGVPRQLLHDQAKVGEDNPADHEYKQSCTESRIDIIIVAPSSR